MNISLSSPSPLMDIFSSLKKSLFPFPALRGLFIFFGEKKLRKVILVLFGFLLCSSVAAVPLLAEEQESGEKNIERAVVEEIKEIKEENHEKIAKVRVRILTGQYSSTYKDIDIGIEDEANLMPRNGDNIFVRVFEKVNLYEEEGTSPDVEFVDYQRVHYIRWLALVFVVVCVITVGIKGLRSLSGGIVLTLLVTLAYFTRLTDTFSPIVFISASFLIVGFVTILLRLKDYKLAIPATLGVALCQAATLLIFASLTRAAHVSPQVLYESEFRASGISEATLNTLFYAAVLFIVFGAITNTASQITKFVKEEKQRRTKLTIPKLVSEGMRIGQKASAGELSSILTVFLGISFVSYVLLDKRGGTEEVWDQMFIASQAITLISVGISVIIIAPISAFVSSLFVLGRGLKRRIKDSQYELRIGTNQNE